MKQTVDVETGMTVYGGNRQTIGTIIEVARFGSDRPGPALNVTETQADQAQISTGYVKLVAREGRTCTCPSTASGMLSPDTP